MLHPIRAFGNQPEIRGFAETASRRHAVGVAYTCYMLEVPSEDGNCCFERNGKSQDYGISNETAVGLGLTLQQSFVQTSQGVSEDCNV